MSMIRMLADEDVRRLVPLDVTLELVESAFRAHAEGATDSFPVVRTGIEDHDGIFGIKSGRLRDPDTLGLKAGGYWRRNPDRHGISAHQSTVVLFEAGTGRPEALLRANYITEARTAAAGAVAAATLANPKSDVVAVFGAGRQARVQVEALALRFALRRVHIVARRAEVASRLAQTWADAPFEVVTGLGGEDACREADIIVTTTPSFEPVLDDAWVRAGTHVNAIGSDTRGKGELDRALLVRARFFVDSEEQSRELGEGQRLDPDGSVAGSLGGVLVGTERGRTGDDDVTVFDSTGVTFQDLIVARHALDRAREGDVGTELPL